MRDTMNHYLVEMTNGKTLEIEAPLQDGNTDEVDWLIDQYYKGRIARLWVNGVEWQEPTE